jgi:multidrug efflux pump subunit AcrB
LIFSLLTALLIAGSYFSYRALGSDLLPAMDEGGFILDYFTPAGSSLAETNQALLKVEEILRSIPEVDNTSRRTGLELGLIWVTEANTGDFTVKLKRDRKRGVEEVISMCELKSPTKSRRCKWNSSCCCRT